MTNSLIDSADSLALLYGETFYISPQDLLAPDPVETVVKAPVPPVAVEKVPSTKESIPQVPKTKLEPVEEAAPRKRGITWKPKTSSVVLFVLQIAEFKNPELTELLKKIVESLGIPTDMVGFGQIDGPVQLEEFDHMPNPHAVVFDTDIWGGAENPVKLGKGEVFFTHRLEVLKDNNDLKRQLWVHLKLLKDRITK